MLQRNFGAFYCDRTAGHAAQHPFALEQVVANHHCLRIGRHQCVQRLVSDVGFKRSYKYESHTSHNN
ncbi:hypothetical protein GCM10009715_06130 [Paeniglutamicibacter psychrophenolicus]